jgi:NADH-quinone oxidoreductase subunit L
MTFHGENRADAHVREHLHESPAIMVYPLVVLAFLAVVGGFVGVPAALGGANHFEHWLAPVFHAGEHGAVHHEAHGGSIEYVLMIASVAVAAIGILLARAMYLTKSVSPGTFADAAGGALHRILYNKYYVDEFYETVFVNGTLLLARISAGFDRYVIDVIVDGAAAVTRLVSRVNGLFDDYVIDGLVNRLADATMGLGDQFRRLQTGSINGYLYAVVGGVVVVMVLRLMWLA